MLFRELTTIPFSTAALKANLLRLENTWEAYQVTREREARLSGLCTCEAINR